MGSTTEPAAAIERLKATVAAALNRKGLSEKEAAGQAGVPREIFLMGDEDGLRPSVDRAELLCSILGITFTVGKAADEPGNGSQRLTYQTPASDYRLATELHDPDQRDMQSDSPALTLAGCSDRDGIYRAGLYHQEEGSPTKDLTAYELLTGAAEWRLVTERIPEDPVERQWTILAIAYNRLRDDKNRPRNIRVPVELQPWSVMVEIAQGRVPARILVTTRAIGARSARAVAAVRLLQNATQSGIAQKERQTDRWTGPR